MKTLIKHFFELLFWRYKKFKDTTLNNSHYTYFYTEYFNLGFEFYSNKKILDIGCGPRGSLEWADMAQERYGLDPMANSYKKLQSKTHKMSYINAYSEQIPFADNYFDVICSFNSIDHVNNLTETCNEIYRVLKPGGLFLLITDVHSKPTLTEPQKISWDFLQAFLHQFTVVESKFLNAPKMGYIYSNIRMQLHADVSVSKNGIITAKLQKA